MIPRKYLKTPKYQEVNQKWCKWWLMFDFCFTCFFQPGHKILLSISSAGHFFGLKRFRNWDQNLIYAKTLDIQLPSQATVESLMLLDPKPQRTRNVGKSPLHLCIWGMFAMISRVLSVLSRLPFFIFFPCKKGSTKTCMKSYDVFNSDPGCHLCNVLACASGLVLLVLKSEGCRIAFWVGKPHSDKF